MKKFTSLMLFRFLALTALYGFVWALRRYFPLESGSSTVLQRAMLALGFVLMAGFFIGYFFHKLRIPRITGYLAGGILCGPYALNIIELDEVRILSVIDEYALIMIAFSAGGEIKLDRLRRDLPSILSISLSHILFIPLLVFASFFLLKGRFDWGSEVTMYTFLILLGVIAACKSPATSVAVILETDSQGRVTDTVLGVTILKDILIIILFTVSIDLLLTWQGGMSFDPASTLHMLGELGLSLLLGLVLSILPIFYLKYVKSEKVLFIMTFSLVVLIMSKLLAVHFLLVAICAGFIVENFSERGEVFVKTLRRASTPVFLIFFTVSGATLNLEVFGAFWSLALLYVSLRLFYTWLVTWLAGRAAGAERSVLNFSWTGFIGQAGVSLGFVAIIDKSGLMNEEFRQILKSIIVGAVILNQLIGPVLFKLGLHYSRETANQRRNNSTATLQDA